MTKVYKGHKDTVNCVAIHSTEPFFASGSADSTIRLVDYELQNNMAILKGHTHSVNCLSWTKEELVSGSSDMSIKIWKSGNKTNVFDLNEFFCTRTLLGHEHIVSGLVSLDDTELTVSVSRDKTIRIWDRTTGFCRKNLSDCHEDWIRCVDANKRYLVTSGNDKRLCVFEVTQLMAFEKGSASSCTYINSFFVHDNFVDSIRIYREGKLVDEEHIAITASRDKTMGVWNFLNGTCLVRLTGHENWVRDIALIEAYNLLVSVGDDKSLRIWDIRKKKQVYIEHNAHDHFVSCLAIHKEFRIVLTGSVDKTAKIWKLINSNSSEFMSSVYA
jgi:platelet-activating factor acetylhydrolase IB subunit alpha